VSVPDSGQQRTALASVAAAGVLVALKLGAGIATGSLSLISAGIESSGDVVAAVLTFLAVRLGGRPADDDHPYGHRRAENLAALGEAAILTGGGVFIVVEAVGRLVGGGEHFEARWYVFAVIAVAICIDLSRIAVSLRSAAKYSSAALRSNAFHFAADLAGSLAVLGGLVLVAAGVQSGDAIAALVVACVIFGAAGRLIYENARVLMVFEQEHGAIVTLHVKFDRPTPLAEAHRVADEIEARLRALDGVAEARTHLEPLEPPRRTTRDPDHPEAVEGQIRALVTRLTGDAPSDLRVLGTRAGLVVLLTATVDAGLSLREAHDVAGALEAAIRAEHLNIAQVVVHTEPAAQMAA
jgi:cation diffusion facilitator family transporter